MEESASSSHNKTRVDFLADNLARMNQARVPAHRKSESDDSPGLNTPRRLCQVCNVVVQPVGNFLTCSICNKWVHCECDRGDPSDVDDFCCPRCRKSPLVGGDAMLATIGPPDSPSALAPSTSLHNDNENSCSFDPFSNGSSPTADSLDQLSQFPLTESHHNTLSGPPSSESSDSGANSPAFCPDPNSPLSDDDFMPGSSRGGSSSRGGRGGKKKPNGRGASNMKTRSGGKPPSGTYSDRLGKGERGKRGKARGKGVPGSAPVGAPPPSGAAPRGARGGRGQSVRSSSLLGGSGGYTFTPVPSSSLLSSMVALSSGMLPSTSSLLQQPLLPPSLHSFPQVCMSAASSAASLVPSSAPALPVEARTRADDEYVRTIVICSEDDQFLSCAPLCLVCGSVGKGTEQSMIACSSCAHTYHTYCVGLHEKMKSAVVNRGWRCLDCTVCEGCGHGNDESKLLMCEDCDVAYHIYCLTPPLTNIPIGVWRCHWCAKCRRCQLRVPGGELTKEGLCQPCHSLRKCPKCLKLYNISDPIIRCSACSRWLHGRCEDLHTEEMLESASLNKMRCSFCRPNSRITNYAANDGNLLVCDNVALNKCADEVLQSKMMPSLFRANSFPDSTASTAAHAAFLADIRSASLDSHYGSMDEEPTDEGETSPAVLPLVGVGSRGGRGGGRGGGAGRGRMHKMGVGGFFLKVPRHRIMAMEEEPPEFDADGNKKTKRQRKPRRSHLEDAYPASIQESFFGVRAVDGKALMEADVPEPVLQEIHKPIAPLVDSRGKMLSREASDALHNDLNESSMLENLDVNMDIMEMDDDFNFDLFEDGFDELDSSLNDAFDIVERDGGIDRSRASSTMEGDVKPSTGPPLVNLQQPNVAPPPSTIGQHGHPMQHPHAQQQQPHMMQQHPHAAHLQQQQQAMAGQNMQMKREPPSRSNSQMGRHEGGTGGPEKVSSNETAQARWEEDEPLGDKATMAAVLYVNVMHPNLKHSFPEWSERVKQIHKIWRGLGPEQRQEYVQKARFNRAQREKIPRPRGPRNAAALAAKTADGGMTVGMRAHQMAAAAAAGMMPPPPTLAQPPQGRMYGGMMGGGMGSAPGGEGMIGGGVGQGQHLAMGGGGMMPFKIPSIPTHSGDQPSVDHLPPDIQAEYAAMQRKQAMLKKQQEDGETDLARLRKMKKTLATKKRIMQKAAPENGPSDLAELGDEDKATLQTVTDEIPTKQKILEGIKRDFKGHMNAMHDFETKYNIQSESVLATAGGGCTPTGEVLRAVGVGGMMGGYQHMLVPQQIPFSQLNPQDRLPLGTPTGMRMMPFPASRAHFVRMYRSAQLGGQAYDALETQEEREVYEVVDTLIEKVCLDIDGPLPPTMMSPLAMPGGGGVKRLLDPMGGVGNGMNGMADEAPKPKKKRQIQKKTGTSSVNDYENACEKLKSALANCKIPKNASEPVQRPDPALFYCELTDLGNKFVNSLPEYIQFAKMKLSFMDDVYANARKMHVPEEVSMARLVPHPSLAALRAMPPHCPPRTSVMRDSQDEASPWTSQCGAQCSDALRPLIQAVHRRTGWLKCTAKPPEVAFQPQEPHRVAFKQCKREEDEEEVEVCLEFFHLPSTSTSSTAPVGGEAKEEKDALSRQLLQALSQMLDVKDCLEKYQVLDTPPQSPSETSSHTVEMKPCVSSLRDEMEEPPSAARTTHSTTREEEKSEGVKGQMPAGRCRLCECEMTESASVRQSLSSLGMTPSDDGRDEMVAFCSLKCYYMFVHDSKIALSHDELARAESFVDEATYTRLKQISADSFARSINARVKSEPCDLHTLPPSLPSSAPPAPTVSSLQCLALPSTSTPPHPNPLPAMGVPPIAAQQHPAYQTAPPASIGLPLHPLQQPIPAHLVSFIADITSPKDTRFFMDDGQSKQNVQVIRCGDLSNIIDPGRNERGRMAGEGWKVFDQALQESFLRIHRQKQELASSAKAGIEVPTGLVDTRQCILCAQSGDGTTSTNGRLLNYDADRWIHANCAIWSTEVYESDSGALLNVDKAIIRGVGSLCCVCGCSGATVECVKHPCRKSFHIHCAALIFGKFLKDKTFVCPTHHDVHCDSIASLEPLRKLYVQRDENKLLSRLFDLEHSRLLLRLGAFTFHRLGQLLPEQLKSCHNQRFIYPVGYTATRLFWSPTDVRRRVRYRLSIGEKEGKPAFTVQMMEGSCHSWTAPSASAAFKQVLDGVAKVRGRADFLRFFPHSIEGENLYGLCEGAITKMTESLPGVDTLYSYNFRHGGAPILELPLAENPSGCARCEPRLRTLVKHRKTAPRGVNSGGVGRGGTGGGGGVQRNTSLYEELLGMAASSQYGSTEQSYSAYQKMRKEWRNTVFLARSKIQGLGLYAKRDIDMGSMIIEYKGEVIRSEVCEMREKRYFAQNRGTYMFRVSDDVVIDATMKGGPARYINHSCDPNCATQIMHIGPSPEERKIIITANRPIKADEELTYDYQFDFEDDGEKVACLCGAPNCQRWMN